MAGIRPMPYSRAESLSFDIAGGSVHARRTVERRVQSIDQVRSRFSRCQATSTQLRISAVAPWVIFTMVDDSAGQGAPARFLRWPVLVPLRECRVSQRFEAGAR